MLPFVAATGIDGPRDWLANPPVVIGILAAIVIGLWLAMLVAAFRRTG